MHGNTKSSFESKAKSKSGPYKPTLIIHGGAGNITRPNLPPDLYAQYQVALTKYLESTYALLVDQDADAVTAACHAVTLMEDDPLFNCGRGSVFTVDGGIEMEASLMISSISGFESASGEGCSVTPDFDTMDTTSGFMDMGRQPEATSYSVKGSRTGSRLIGRTKKSAAVSMITRTRHPILLAKEVLGMADPDNERSQKSKPFKETEISTELRLPGKGEMHAHLSGHCVEEWGFRERGLERKGRKWFWTRKRWEEHRRGLGLDVSDRAWKMKLCQELDMADSELEHYNSDLEDEVASEESECDVEDEIIDQVLEVPSQGTVGAVCMDSWGNLCVATSTGGLTNKRTGRIGDTPTLGAGFWAEHWEEVIEDEIKERTSVDNEHTMRTRHGQKNAAIDVLSKATSEAARFWVGDCLPIFSGMASERDMLQPLSTDSHAAAHTSVDFAMDQKRPYIPTPQMMSHQQPTLNHLKRTSRTNGNENNIKIRKKTIHRAVAMSGTGNGDSFLRTNAVRTAAAIPRFASHFGRNSPGPISLQHGVTAVAGPGGELQRSAEDRWDKGTGEGEGGIIGIDLVLSAQALEHEGAEKKSPNGQISQVKTDVVWDFNCGGMWRAYFEEVENGSLEPRVMVFRDEYRL